MSNEDRPMTLVEHLEDLRRAVAIAGSAWVATTTIAFIFNARILNVLLHPLMTILPSSNPFLHEAIFTSPTEGLTVPIKVSLAVGFILALPIIVWQTWTFISPGLRPAERRFAGPFIASSILLFACGAVFAYFAMPWGLGFLASFLNGNAIFFPDINSYLSFFVVLIIAFGITFELPVVIVLLGMLGIVSSRWLRQRRRAIWLAIVVLALLVTPGADPFTPTALAVPLLGLFELSVLVLNKVLKR